MTRKRNTADRRAPRRKRRDLDEIIDELGQRAGDDEVAEHEFRAVALISELADQVFEMRTSQGMTQEQLASQCGLTQPAIAVLENPGVDREPTLTTLIKVGLGLGKKVVISFEEDGSINVTGSSTPPGIVLSYGDGSYHETEVTS